MMNLFKKRTAKEHLEEAKQTYTTPPESKKPEHTYYRLGITDGNRVSFAMGYSEITMNRAGVDSMIHLLTTYKNMIPEDKQDE